MSGAQSGLLADDCLPLSATVMEVLTRMDMDPAALSTRRKKDFRPLLIWAVFTFVGPLFGSLSLLMPSLFKELTIGRGDFDLPTLAGILAFIYPFALAFGGVQATFVGVIAASSFVTTGKVSLLAVIVSSAVAWALFVIATASRARNPLTWLDIVAPSIPHLGAGFACWLLVARLRGAASGRGFFRGWITGSS